MRHYLALALIVATGCTFSHAAEIAGTAALATGAIVLSAAGSSGSCYSGSFGCSVGDGFGDAAAELLGGSLLLGGVALIIDGLVSGAKDHRPAPSTEAPAARPTTPPSETPPINARQTHFSGPELVGGVASVSAPLGAMSPNQKLVLDGKLAAERGDCDVVASIAVELRGQAAKSYQAFMRDSGVAQCLLYR